MTQPTRRFHLCFCLVFLLLAWLPLSANPALAAPARLEDLHYRLSALIWQDAARVRLTLKRLGPTRFHAEVIGKTQGFIKFLSGNRRERMETEMVWRDQRLMPLVYREESRWRDKRSFKEYRFDYPHGRLELWEWHAGKGLLKKWQTKLSGPIYDPLSAFYNCRLGIMGPTRQGQTVAIPGIPYPKPELMEVRLGPETPAGRKAMLSLVNPVFHDSRGVVFAYV
ncbi:MAG TPA: DUF3108 domain-containing protein, partial [Desulfobaccales bacterium]|nr:DUF3108 domain-containing protein [Desulfobaccales bacterium]